MIADEIFRGRFRNSFEKPEPITPSEVTPFTIDLHTDDHVFKKGHRIMVQVQSTWFPLYDRNPQKFVPNIFEAKESDYQKATQRIYRSSNTPQAWRCPCSPLALPPPTSPASAFSLSPRLLLLRVRKVVLHVPRLPAIRRSLAELPHLVRPQLEKL